MARNALTKAAARETSAANLRSLPHSVALVLKDPPPMEIQGELKTVAWRVPTMIPAKEQLEEARAHLEQALAPVGSGLRAAVLPYVTVLEIPNLLEDMTPAQERAWYDTRLGEYERLIGHVPLDLLKAALDAHVLKSKFFPAISELMAHAGPELEKRKRQAERVGYMIESLNRPKPKPQAKPFEREPEHVRLLGVLKHYERPGSLLYSPAKAHATRARLLELGHEAPGEPPPLPPEGLTGKSANVILPDELGLRGTLPRDGRTWESASSAAAPTVEAARWQAGEPVYSEAEPPPPDEIPEADNEEEQV